ncbi:S1 RNA-binding domain-containing protein [Candidatus Woesearchaeota archaeon]|jgi:translation initiation factor 2 subunit 1|nr:S1 RNA-binding domain-containing protein [Candidatus Woesearchaeota archaeon]
MFYKREGIPEPDEIVLCKVTKIYPNSVFVDLLEYNDSGMVHISEVSPGRIRNLRDYVSIGRQIVCKVLRIDRERGHIDLSLRRVNSSQRKEKLEETKAELKAESILKTIAKRLGQKTEEIYRQVSDKVFEEYSYLYLCFKDVASGDADLMKLGVDKVIAKELTKVILDKFRPERITIEGEINVKTYASEGVKKIREILLEIESASPTIKLFYLGAGRYKIIIEDVDYKPAEKNFKKVESILEKFKDKISEASLERDKN